MWNTNEERTMSDRPEGVAAEGDILEWLSLESERARAAVAAVRKRRREAEREKSNSQQRGTKL